jgi:glycosyltransferase involved in cell wall biosynthesis
VLALMFGSARRDKGYDRIISALPELHKAGIHVVFAGTGYDAAVSEDVVAAASLLPHFIPEYELPALFAAVDVVLLPYRHCTTSGLAVLSIGFGKPVVCSPVGPLVTICQQGLGVLTDPDDATSLAQAVADASLLCGSSAYEEAREVFLAPLTWDRIAGQTVAVYEEVAERSK